MKTSSYWYANSHFLISIDY